MSPVGSFRRRFGRWVVGIIITLVLGFGFYYLSNWAFTIRSIEIVGEHAQIVVDQKRISKNLLFFPSEVFREQILASNPWLSDVRFEKKFPGTLRVVPVLRTPVATLRSSDRIVLLDETSMVLADGDGGSTLPVVDIPLGAFRVGQILTDPRVVLAVSLVDRMKAEMKFSRILYENGSYLRAKADTLDIIIAQDANIEETMATLQMLLSGFRIKGTLPKVVDLRFDKPIVTF